MWLQPWMFVASAQNSKNLHSYVWIVMTQSLKAKHLSRQCELINASLWQLNFLNNKKGKMSIPPHPLPPPTCFWWAWIGHGVFGNYESLKKIPRAQEGIFVKLLFLQFYVCLFCLVDVFINWLAYCIQIIV